MGAAPGLGRDGLGGAVRVAALFVDARGVYAGLPDVEVWDEVRDARTYPGPWPVVAHPPCARWSRLAGLVEARWGHRRGDDGGCFAAALAAVRRWCGVLEHPAYTDAFAAFGLPAPPRHGWQRALLCGGWVCHVEQGWYGHAARKATWLYAVGVTPPELHWGEYHGGLAWVSWCGNRTRGAARPRLSKRAASATPIEFRDLLLSMARSAGLGRRSGERT